MQIKLENLTPEDIKQVSKCYGCQKTLVDSKEKGISIFNGCIKEFPECIVLCGDCVKKVFDGLKPYMGIIKMMMMKGK